MKADRKKLFALIEEELNTKDITKLNIINVGINRVAK